MHQREFKEITLPDYIQMYTGVHSDVAQESNSFDLFDVPLHIPLECKKVGIHGLVSPGAHKAKERATTTPVVPTVVKFQTLSLPNMDTVFKY